MELNHNRPPGCIFLLQIMFVHLLYVCASSSLDRAINSILKKIPRHEGSIKYVCAKKTLITLKTQLVIVLFLLSCPLIAP